MSADTRLVNMPLECGTVKSHLFSLYQAINVDDITPRLPVYYLQGIRRVLKGFSIDVQERYRNDYELRLPSLLQDFVTGVKSSFDYFEFGLISPSSRKDAEPYFDALLKEGIINWDVSGVVSKNENFRSATANNLEEVLAAVSIDRTSTNINFESIDSLLIVDDVVASGRTMAAIILRMQEAGLRADATVCVATPLLIGNWYKPGDCS